MLQVSLQSVLKIWQVLKSKENFIWKMYKLRNTVFYDLKSRFLVIFFSNYRHRLVISLKKGVALDLNIFKQKSWNFRNPDKTMKVEGPTGVLWVGGFQIWRLSNNCFINFSKILLQQRVHKIFPKKTHDSHNFSKHFWYDFPWLKGIPHDSKLTIFTYAA